MEPGFIFTPHLLITIVLLVGAVVGRRWALIAALPLIDAVLLAIYVFGEDTYRDDGTTRWDAYRSGGALGPLFVVSVVFLVACAALLAYAAARRRDRLFRWTAVTCAAGALLLVFPVILGFSLN